MSVYQKFQKSFGRDGPDFSILNNLSESERKTMIEELGNRLNFHDILALGCVGSESEIPILRYYLDSVDVDIRLAASRALWDVASLESALIYIGEIIKYASDDMHLRVMGLGMLMTVKNPKAFVILQESFFDDKYMVRANAAMIHSCNSKISTTDELIEKSLLIYDQTVIEEFKLRMIEKI